MDIIQQLKELHMEHYSCEDSWYACPFSSEGSANLNEKECNCGVKEHNDKLYKVLVEVTQELHEKNQLEVAVLENNPVLLHGKFNPDEMHFEFGKRAQVLIDNKVSAMFSAQVHDAIDKKGEILAQEKIKEYSFWKIIKTLISKRRNK